MGINGELRINGTLLKAFREVLGKAPATASPVVVLAAYLHSLMNEYGLTDSQHVDPDKLELPPLANAAREFIQHFLARSEDVDSLRDSLYRVLTPMADNADIRRRINKSNKLSDGEVLLLGQIAWNLEHNAQRPRLPLKPRQIWRDDKPFTLDIPVPKQDVDFATMRWTKRRNLSGVPGKSTGASFASQAARLAVLAAKWLLESSAQPVPDVGEACLLDGGKGTKRVVWDTGSGQELAPASTGLMSANSKAQEHNGPVFVGDFAEVGDRYQRRGIDSEIAHLWGDGGDRRVWLRGGPGLGKSYTARKVMQETLSGVDDDRHDLLIWVNSADSVAVTREFSRAAERLNGLGDSVPADAADRDNQLTRALLDHLRTTDTRWLIVLDDADAEGLIENKLVPTGVNPRGRVLITTLSNSHRIDGVGRHVEAELFSRAEAEEFLKNRLPETSQDSRVRLTQTLRQHPLALSIAASTIAANRMAVSAWIEEFDHANRMDEAADYSDVGGYPRLIGTTWQLALDRASEGMPNGVVERAAMIAALQDPDGHPTWLWQRDDVREWVAGGTDLVPNRGRMHPCIKRLVDYGIIRLIGGWQDGRLAIHQLAARAIRESAAPEALAELGALLADQWLLEITANPANTQSKDVWAAIGPIAALPNLKLTARNTAAALLGFSQPSTSEQVLGWERDELELMRPHLSRGGAIGLADLARRLVGIGLGDRGLGRQGRADKLLTEAVNIYERLTEIPGLSDDLRAAYLESLADLDTELNRPGLAFERRTNAAKLRERFQVSNAQEDKLISNQLALVDLYQELSDVQRTEAALDRALSIGAGQVPADAEADALAQAGLGRRLVSAGRTEEAEKYLRRAAELYETTELGRIVYFRGIATELGYICARAGKWGEAEDWFTRSEREPVLLASVLLHQGRCDDARATLTRAANHAEAVAQPNPLVDARIRADIEDSLLPMLYSLTRKAINRERVQDAADLTQVCLELTRAREDLSPGDNPMELADAYFRAAITSRSAERHDTAVSFFTSYVNILEMLVQITPSDELQSKYGQSLYWLAATTQEAGDQEHAVSHARRAVKILSHLDSEDARQFLNLSLSVLGQACLQIGASDEAIASFRHRVDVWQKEMEQSPVACDIRRSLASAYGDLGQALAATPQSHDAVQPLKACLDLYLDLCRVQPDDSKARAEVANALFLLAFVYDRCDSPAESASFAERAALAWQELIDVDPSNAELQIKLANTLILLCASLGKLERDPEAVDALARAANHFQLPAELQPSKHKLRFMQLLDGLERGLRELGRIDQASKVRARANDFDRRYPLPADEG
ncbi:NB-ARC domain-containing protein [Arthrobacter sp. zg-Y895]|uniref:NB-ARC domain-containing protein n=1 Tax=Arthrobacter sp. zg-Y895 TaxID=2886933 RepID=UPI001D13FB94|nr:NB-ARC domain-containing protein [Arthrobacter sp. zg-Y895]MCC3300678.1 tetratricopeptide repeat protein [Arthrobacter sp. zg-Y895]